MVILLMEDGNVLDGKMKSLLDRCVRKLYAPVVASGYTKPSPLLGDLYCMLKDQDAPEAQELALRMEIYTAGSYDMFAQPTNVDTQAHIIDYDLSKLGEGMNAVGMLIVLESIYSRLMDNWRKKRHTYIYIDEIMTIFRNPYAAQYFASLWQRIRKRGGYIIGATQNTTEILNSPEARKLLENSYIITMRYQSAPDRDVLAEMFSLSEAQKQALAKEQYGTGLIKVGSTIVPFENDFPTDNPLYQLMSTKPSDGWGQEVNEHMCRGNKSIPSILQNLWDAELRDANVMIILCGSAMSFIEKELLAEKNPLYGRATGIYKMKEMGFYDAAKFFPDYSDRDKVLAYAVLGGIPHYLRQWNPGLSIDENIKRNILTKGCILYSEVEFLLHQELRETPIYNSIIEAVALGNTKLNDISQKSLVEDTSKTSVYLKNLIELGIVEREFSVDAKTKEQANSGRGAYRLTDNFFRFWYAFGFANFSQLEDGDVDGVYEYVVKPALHKFASFTFEDICREFVREMQKKNELPFRYAKMGRWFGKTTVRDEKAASGLRTAETEIDILCIDRGAKEYLVGECKFKGVPFSYSEYCDTVAKLSPLKEKAKFHYALFSENGFDKKIIDHAAENETQLYTLNQIVHYA